MDAIDKILGDIHYESSGLAARLVVQHDIDEIGNHQGTGALEVVVERNGTLEYAGAIAVFENPPYPKTMPTGPLRADPRPITPHIIPVPVLTIYFSEANLPAEPAKTAATCLAVKEVYDEALARFRALPQVETSFTDSLTTAIRDAQRARAAEAAREARTLSYINPSRRPGPDYPLT